ncbi:lipid IV(A) 3-deoxy-D-manno-octulosonic acid transferase [Vibrio sp.]|nr:lipid IV(A) 3-deoxy-D-manno-octulosonic acid transferase [Vibrio sp.]
MLNPILTGLYTLLILIASPIYLSILIRKMSSLSSAQHRWLEYIGLGKIKSESTRPIWIHAVSVGESMGIIPLIREIKKSHPAKCIIVTTTTSTGAQIIMSQLKDDVTHYFMPFDIPWCVRRFVTKINPETFIIMETELWPNTLSIVNSLSIPITVINARLSEKSCKSYQKLGSFFRRVLNKVDHIVCQNPSDRERFERLGMDASKLSVSGSLKFDIKIDDAAIEKGVNIRSEFGDRPIWIAASTHQGEDEQLLTVHQQILKQLPNALLILVPRHPERFDSVFKLCTESFDTVRRTGKLPVKSSSQVYLADTMGELIALFAASDVCFMAGSLIGDKVGGHNPLEPAAVGLPVITGPSYYNFKDIYRCLFELGIAFEKSIPTEIAKTVCSHLENKNKLGDIKIKAKTFVEHNRGALHFTSSAILQYSNDTVDTAE